MHDPLIDCATLAARIGQPGTTLLEATWYLPAETRDAQAEYCTAHLPGAAFFDIDRVADRSSDLPHMLPGPAAFAQAVGALGIGNEDEVIVYDRNGLLASARLWWTFRVYGHERVRVLDGGWQSWLDGAGPTAAGISQPAPRPYRASERPALVRDLAAMRTHCAAGDVHILDARPPGRFAGRDPEPRPGLRGGHMPGSRNWFYKEVIDAASGRMREPEHLAEQVAALGLDDGRSIVTTCGSGVTAAILALALYRLGRRDVAVYDGSWSEWAARADTPVESEAV